MMNNRVEEIKRQFTESLNPHEYNETFTTFREQTQDYFYDFWFTSLYEFFKSNKFQGGRLLDVGCGATVHNIASASAYFPEIVLSDFVEANRKELMKWLRGGPQILDWSPFLDMVASVEGYSDMESGRKEIEARIRAAVKSVVHCDVLEDDVIPPEVSSPYDVILTSLALEVAAVDFDAFVHILKRLRRLLRQGGVLIMLGVTECSYWKVGNNRFHSLFLTDEDIAKAVKEAHLEVVDWKLKEKDDYNAPFDYGKVYFITCVKL